MNIFSGFPNKLLAQLYTRGSAYRHNDGITFSLKNRLIDVLVEEVCSILINGNSINLDSILMCKNDEKIPVRGISKLNPLDFPLKQKVSVFCNKVSISDTVKIEVNLNVRRFGKLKLVFDDKVKQEPEVEESQLITRKIGLEDYSSDVISDRLRFVEKHSNVNLSAIRDYSIDPKIYKNRCENFIGTANIPLGIAGPVKVNGRHAIGDFLIPFATTEGTLVASYNRGIKLVNLCGGVNTIVIEDLMQRAPVFVFKDALSANTFDLWVKDKFTLIKDQAESTSNFAKLIKIEPYQSNKFVFLRFNFTTGDASGQNMVNKATLVACNWIIGQYDQSIEHFYLESNMATDKKPSFLNSLNTRGKKVTADITIDKDILMDVMRVQPKDINYHESVANIGAFLSRTNNNGLHSTNALAAIFIATGQDVACLAESSACITYSEVLANGDLYASVTLPSLVLATHGGGTGLPSQQECLKIMGCDQLGSVYKLAEIISAVVIAGELSLACAISSLDWVVSHEEMGR
jgi:hydroxymethylglutaryl-CoA reductase (NADPH)